MMHLFYVRADGASFLIFFIFKIILLICATQIFIKLQHVTGLQIAKNVKKFEFRGLVGASPLKTMEAGLPSYPDCKIPREPPSITLENDIAEKVGKDFKVLPIFEKFLFEYKYRKYYSLQTNKFLQCRWRSYLRHYEDREFAPFTFVDKRDFHYYNGMIRLLPSESIHRTKNFPFKMGLGPGVDFRGQMPIPQDMMMKRGIGKPKAERKIYDKAKKEGDDEEKDKKTDE